MSNKLNSEFIKKVSILKYNKFCNALEHLVSPTTDINFFQNEVTVLLINQIARDLFAEEIGCMLDLLNDEEVGVAVLDVPELPQYSVSSNTIFGAAVILGIFKQIGIPNIDPINQLPFAVHTASHSSAELLSIINGALEYSPEIKLGFHNDGLLSDDLIEIPNHIVVYNMFINYRVPGNFLWIPTRLWKDAGKFAAEAISNDLTLSIKLTPSYYRDTKGDVKNSMFEMVTLPATVISENGEYLFFLNGEVNTDNNSSRAVDFIRSMRDSLENNYNIYRIPQRERRAIFMKNLSGFHARDIFQEPLENIDLTRVFLRLVDSNAQTYSSHNITEI